MQKYSFLYFGHGSAYSPKALGMYILFRGSPSTKAKIKLLREVPLPLKAGSQWLGNILVLASSEAYEEEVKSYIRKYNGSTVNYWVDFEQILESQLLKIHQISPITAVYKPSNDKYSYNFSKWHKWSVAAYDKFLLPQKIDNKIGIDLNVKEYIRAFLIMLNGFFTERSHSGKKLSKSAITLHIAMIDEYLKKIKHESDYKSSETIYFIYALNDLLNQFDHKKYKQILKTLSVNTMLFFYKQYPEKLYVANKTLDISNLQSISGQISDSNSLLFSDLLGSILVESDKLNSNSKRDLLIFLSEYITAHRLTDIFAVNLLYESINAKGNDKIIGSKIFNAVVDAAIKDKKILADKYVKSNIIQYCLVNWDNIAMTPSMKKLFRLKEYKELSLHK